MISFYSRNMFSKTFILLTLLFSDRPKILKAQHKFVYVFVCLINVYS